MPKALEQTNYQPGLSNFGPITLEKYNSGDHMLTRVANLIPIQANRFNGLEANIQPQDYPMPTHNGQVLVVCCGIGTDSIGMLIAMKERGVRPDLVQWADTGSERNHTYEYINILIKWLDDNDFPPLLIVRLVCPKAGHESLFAQLWNTEQLPSPAFHKNHSCPVKWKITPQRNFHRFLPWIDTALTLSAIGFSAEETSRRIHGVAEAVGFSSEETKRKSYQVTDKDGYQTYYPLQEWNITRADCVELIAKEGLPQPGKSSCFFCPMMKKCELKGLNNEQLEAAYAMEQRAEDGGKLNKVRGLRVGSNQTWKEWMAEEDVIEPVQALLFN